MTRITRPHRMLVLGATGKVARLLGRHWHLHPPTDLEPVFVARRAMADTRVLEDDGDASGLGSFDSLVALWGVTPPGPVELNTHLAERAMEIGKSVGARRVFHMSSAAVYGRGLHLHDETCAPDPENAYGAAKAAMEERVLKGDHGTAEQVILRVGNVVGADSLFRALAGPDPVRLDRFPDGRGPIRSYLGIRTLADSLAALGPAPSALPSLMNLCESQPTDMQDIALAAGARIVLQDAPETANPVVALAADRLAKYLDLPPERAAADALVAEWRHVRGALA